MSGKLTAKQCAALNRLKTVGGHRDGAIRRLMSSNASYVDVMKQSSAMQSSPKRSNRVRLHKNLDTCLSTAILDGHGHAAVAVGETVGKVTSVLTVADTICRTPRKPTRQPRMWRRPLFKAVR